MTIFIYFSKRDKYKNGFGGRIIMNEDATPADVESVKKYYLKRKFKVRIKETKKKGSK